MGVLAHDAAGMCTAWVEVPQQGTVELLIWLARLLVVPPFRLQILGDDGLDHDLCLAVGVGGADWAVLGDRNHVRNAGGIAVDGGRRGEDNVGDIVLLHGAQERDAAADIDAVVLERDQAGFADSLQGCKVDDAIDLRVLVENPIKGGLVCDVDLVKGRALAGDELNAIDGNL